MVKATAEATGLRSMTGFAAARGTGPGGAAWTWDLRSVNGKGLDLRLRLPEGIDGLEAALRSRLGQRIARGSVTLNLRLTRGAAGEGSRLNPAGLTAALAALAEVEAALRRQGLIPAPISAAAVLSLRGVTDTGGEADPQPGEDTALVAAILADLDPLLDAFDASRAAEGRALAALVGAQIDRIAALATAARDMGQARRDDAAQALAAALARITALTGTEMPDPARIAQELALLAVKSDVTEELDRLDAHVAAARALMVAEGPVGRRFDFLMQEFIREANTLCSKSGHAGLTAIGLDLKHVIDQMREQVQNVE
ncbi:YicC/YloC family endoribonuclease [Frigidibacter oleivorans]|uniref:YicC/YloC family endoribonuclease n=1 Tax=Frigidibacter oleivorans TaxID=2487129 RepID=UPI001F2AF7BE|nr:YicC/YloC family endoribonuclease [Frigidibacter oleivorans]